LTFAIQTGIAKPARAFKTTIDSVYPFGAMNVGDMFHVPRGDSTNVKLQRRLQSAAGSFKKRDPNTNYKFSMRSIELQGVPGVGVWRDQ
jgi:hypothetical protein